MEVVYQKLIKEREKKDKVLNYLCDLNCFEQGYTIRNMSELLSNLELDFDELRLVLSELKHTELFRELSFNTGGMHFVLSNSAKEFIIQGGFLGEIKFEKEKQEKSLQKEELEKQLNLLNIALIKAQLKERRRNSIIAILSVLLTAAGTYIAYLSYIGRK
ncbi:MAG: hypothetical protein ACXVPN_03740 [Bacteroidia bacterium]